MSDDLKESIEQQQRSGKSNSETNPLSVDQSTAALSSTAPDYIPAKVTKRFAAAFIDHGILFVIMLAIGLMFNLAAAHYVMTGKALLFADLIRPDNVGLLLLFLLAYVSLYCIPIFYFAFFESSKSQATPGKKFAGLKVVGRKNWKMGFGRSVWKSLLQVFVLYLFTVICSISLAFLGPMLELSTIPGFTFFAFELLLLGFVFCIPIFGGRQSLIDKICGRLEASSAPAEEAESKTSIGSVLRTATTAFMLAAIIPALIMSIAYNYVLITKSLQAYPIAEQGFALKAAGKQEAKDVLDNARKTFHDIDFTYSILANCASIAKSDKTSEFSDKSAYFANLNKADPGNDYDEWLRHSKGAQKVIPGQKYEP